MSEAPALDREAMLAFLVREFPNAGFGDGRLALSEYGRGRCRVTMPLDERTIRKACFLELPRYKQPSVVRIVESLPKSDRGKVLRKALREQLANERPSDGGDGA